MFERSSPTRAPSLEDIRKQARLLVIDDQAFPPQGLFTRDGYHIERWPKIRNLSQLTDNHFDLILLDLHGVGLNESPERQGLGILQHVKEANPTQIVIAYSAQGWSVAAREYFDLADEVLEKGADYIEFKTTVDRLLQRRATSGYFITQMNKVLGDDAAQAPKAVAKALSAIKSGSVDDFRRYLGKQLTDAGQIDRAVKVISIAVTVLRVVHGS